MGEVNTSFRIVKRRLNRLRCKYPWMERWKISLRRGDFTALTVTEGIVTICVDGAILFESEQFALGGLMAAIEVARRTQAA
jgi:hypothetical protein